jgi:hypothetical protein
MTISVPAAVDPLEGPAVLLPTYQKVTPALLAQMRAEFLEMPGLHLTPRQAARLWNLDVVTCDVALRMLVEEHFLGRTRHGDFRRAEG